MKKIAGLITCSMLSLFIAQCSMFETLGPKQDVKAKSVKIAIKAFPGFDTVMDYATVKVSAPDMKTIESGLNYANSMINGVVSKIPVGSNRHFEVSVFGFDGQVAYYGDAYADIRSLDTTLVQIVLKKPLGTAIINGWIEDVEPEKEWIVPPAQPWISASKSTDTGWVIQFTTSRCSTSNYEADKILYSFDAFQVTGEDSMSFHRFADEPVAEFTFYKDGTFLIFVTVSCRNHPEVIAQSEVLFFRIIDGVLSSDNNLPPVSDTVPPVITIPWGDTIDVGMHDTLNFDLITAYDDVDGDLTSKIIFDEGGLVWSVASQYNVKLSVTDSSRNMTVKEMVIVIRNKNIKPDKKYLIR